MTGLELHEVLKLFDLKRREIINSFNAADEVGLTPYEDNKLKGF